jgi:hypothetical protein
MDDDKAAIAYTFDSVGHDVFLVVDGQRIAKTEFLVANVSRARWTVIEKGWEVGGTLGQPVIVRTAA